MVLPHIEGALFWSKIKLNNKIFKNLLTTLFFSDIIIMLWLISHRGIAQLVEQRSPKPRAEGSSPSAPAMMAWQNRWHAQKSPKYRAFLLPKSRKFYFDFHRWHWAVLAMCKDLNSQKSKLNPLQRSKYRQTSIFSAKNSTQSFGLGFSGFHEIWKHWNRVLFCFLENQVIENLSAICEPVNEAFHSDVRFCFFLRHSNIIMKAFWCSSDKPRTMEISSEYVISS